MIENSGATFVFWIRLVCSTVAVMGVQSALAQQPESNTKSMDPRAASATSSNEDSSWPSLDVPADNTDGKLIAFLDRIKGLKPSKPEQYIAMQRAIRSASKKILESKPDPASAIFKQAQADFVSSSVLLLGNDGPDAQVKTYERFRDYLRDKETIEFVDIQMAFIAGQNLEQMADIGVARQAYSELAETLKAKNDESLSEIVATFQANAKRLGLPGNKLPIKGSTLSGESFDLESLNGKIVLVYFWMSNSPPCENDIPVLKSLYEKFHDKGFEIVGICLDEKRAAALEFTKRHEIAWTSLWSGQKDGMSKAMQNYGISAIPTLILVDRENVVAALIARSSQVGPVLDELLVPKPAVPSPNLTPTAADSNQNEAPKESSDAKSGDRGGDDSATNKKPDNSSNQSRSDR